MNKINLLILRGKWKISNLLLTPESHQCVNVAVTNVGQDTLKILLVL